MIPLFYMLGFCALFYALAVCTIVWSVINALYTYLDGDARLCGLYSTTALVVVIWVIWVTVEVIA